MSLPNPSDFQGIMQRCFDSTNNALRITSAAESQFVGPEGLALIAGTRTLVVTNDVPRLSMVDGVTTTYGVSFLLPGYWTGADFGFYYTSSATDASNFRWRTAVKKHSTFIDNISEAFLSDVSTTLATPDVGVVTAEAQPIDNLNVTPDVFGSLFTFIVSRLGADGADNSAASAELIGMYCRRNA